MPPDLPEGDVLIIAGDLCHARVFSAEPGDVYAERQRQRVQRFADLALKNFTHVIMVLGNHDHFDGVLNDTAAILRQHLPGIDILDDEYTEIAGVPIFGATLWSDFEGRDPEAMKRAGKGCGEFFFVKRRQDGALVRFRPADALAAFDGTCAALSAFMAETAGRRSIIITHHAPSKGGLNPMFKGNGLDGAYASDLDSFIETCGAAVWIHGHTHIRRKYRIGATELRTNARGFVGKDISARRFTAAEYFEL